MHILEQWKLNDIEKKADQAYSRLYEIDSVRSDLASMERAMWEIRSVVDGLRNELQACQEEVRVLREASYNDQ